MTIEAQAITPTVLWIGRAISGLAIAFLLLDAAMKLVPLTPVIDAMQGLGFAGGNSLARGLGVLLLGCTILYTVPSTAPLGALLLTGYLGGAIAVQLRAGNPMFSHVLFGGYIGLAVWAGLLLRSGQLRSLLLNSAP
jgi:hypothetical protein